MRVVNYRAGFANNSSSSHSTVINIDKRPVEEILPDFLSRVDGKLYFNWTDGCSFGWDEFTLTTPDAVDLYIAAQVYSNLPWKMSKEDKNKIIDKVIPGFSYKYREFLSKDKFYLDVDHQSVWKLPRNGGDLDLEFIISLRKYLRKNHAIIFGGNDNSDYNEEKEEFIRSFTEVEFLNMLCYSDKMKKDGDTYIFFNSFNGDKIRVNLSDGDYKKSSTPELVDLIITNRCGHGCKFCYRDCTPNGRNGKVNDIVNIINQLIEMEVFEIILGGGNVLEHPNFEYLMFNLGIIKSKHDIVFNSTIRPYVNKFGDDFDTRLGLLLKTCSSVAISYTKDFLKFFEHCDNMAGDTELSMQVIPEILTEEEKSDILKIADDYYIPITLLGYKHTGRGEEFSNVEKERMERNKKGMLEFFKELSETNNRIAVDTQFLADYPEIREKINQTLYTTEEGKFSCCIDTVDMTISPSSYSEVKIPLSETDIKTAFRSF